MKFYEFGDKHNPMIPLLPGSCCHWKANLKQWAEEIQKCCGI